MAIAEGKKRVAFTLSQDVIDKLLDLYELDKIEASERIYESDTLVKLIEAAYDEQFIKDAD